MKFLLYLFIAFIWLVVIKWAGLEVALATAFAWVFVALVEIGNKMEDKK